MRIAAAPVAGARAVRMPIMSGRGQRVPEMGEVARGGSTRPSAGVSYSHVSARSVSRGGFGRSAGFHGGFGGA